MERQLLGFSRCDEPGDGDKAAVACRELRPPPEIAEEHPVCVFRERRNDRTGRRIDARRPCRLGSRIEFQWLPRLGRNRLDAALIEDLLCRVNGGNGVRPTGVEGEMGDDLADLAWGDAVF